MQYTPLKLTTQHQPPARFRHPKRNQSSNSSNPPFSGAFAVSFREGNTLELAMVYRLSKVKTQRKQFSRHFSWRPIGSNERLGMCPIYIYKLYIYIYYIQTSIFTYVKTTRYLTAALNWCTRMCQEVSRWLPTEPVYDPLINLIVRVFRTAIYSLILGHPSMIGIIKLNYQNFSPKLGTFWDSKLYPLKTNTALENHNI